MNFQEPCKIYTAYNNVEAHLVADMLKSNGITALASEDQSGVSLFMFGTINQFHKPDIWIEKSDSPRALELIHKFEEDKRKHSSFGAQGQDINATCEECGEVTPFPARLNGTTQQCAHCAAYIDVGESDWDEDVGEEE
jgi:hypothetical protein